MKLIIGIVVALAVILGGWYFIHNHNSGSGATPTESVMPSESDMISPTASTSGSPMMSPSATTTLNSSSNTSLGTFLTAGNGMTLYMFKNDSANTSTCTGSCAAEWPPYTVSGSAMTNLLGVAGISGSIATIVRADGTHQVTYNGAPLYFHEGDVKVGDTTGSNYSSLWTVVKP